MELHDTYNRSIDYLRVSVTDRCNFRCVYCMPPEGLELLKHSDILTYEELVRIIAVLTRQGIRKVRITGGEPLVRKGIVDFVRAVKSLGSIDDLSLTTNGSLLAPLAEHLKAAGLDRVNISLDTINPERFHFITGNCGQLSDTLKGIESALQAGLTPVKLNVVLSEAVTEADIAYFSELVIAQPVAIRFIEYMPIGHGGVGPGMSVQTVKELLEKYTANILDPVASNGKGNGPAKYYRVAKAKGCFGFITPISEHFCGSCNRIRLTADGKFRPCLLSNQELDIKTPLRNGATDTELVRLFSQVIGQKPGEHKLTGDDHGFKRKMSQIGG
ncbi:GTP 3',8-cyclase MoaA [Anaerospora sp.]|jgi:cyclic pyranopterin phosphate synthase|uniref:GTP 3',8-cyclase MoaA n=1 Tax=Anaerospora sp. TaxID=1960278 RepID=UPI00289CD854|nr:GTP 3',8-cyclase MoaA [Anaerospora sp.]